MSLKRMTLSGAAFAGAAVALYVLHGSVAIDSNAGSSVIDAPNHWLASARASTASAPAGDGGSAAPTFDGVLEVHVVANGQPVRAASVKLYQRLRDGFEAPRVTWQPLESTGETNDAGVVLLPANSGAYVAAVRAHGFPATLQELQRPSGESRTRVEIALEQGVPLKGLTQDAQTHQAVTPASITVNQPSMPSFEAVTVDADARGQFAIEALAPGRYQVVGVAPGVGQVRATVLLPQAEPLKLVFRPVGFVEGFVHFADGGVAAQAKVLLVGEDTMSTETSASGSFSLEAAPGVWRAQAYRDALVGHGPGEIIVRSGETVTASVIVLQGASHLFGRVISNDAGIEHALVKVSPHEGDGEVARAETDATGAYRIPLVSGVYDVEAAAQGEAEVSTMGIQVEHETQLDLVVPLHGSIRGEVVDEAGVGLSGVVIEARRNYRSSGRTTVSAEGHFEFHNLPPGMVSVVGRREGQLMGATAFIRVESGQPTEVRLISAAETTLEGVIHWRCPGKPRAVTLSLRGSTLHSGAARRVVAAGETHFRFAVAPATYAIEASIDGDDECFGKATVTVDQQRRQPVVLDLERRGLLLEVSVKEADGQPSPNALVTVVDAADPKLMLAIGPSDEAGIFRERELVGTMKPRTRPIQVIATSGGRRGSSDSVAPGVRSVVITLARGEPLELTLKGVPDGARSTVEAVSVPSFSFADTFVTTGPRLSLDSVPLGRLHVTVRSDGRIGDGEVLVRVGAPAKLTVRLEKGGGVRGRLVNEHGLPKSGWAGLVSADHEENGEGDQVDDSGLFEIELVRPGTYFLKTWGSNEQVPVLVKAGETTKLGDIVVPDSDEPH